MGSEVIAGVDVPASCANLGPGFDALAAAVDVYLQVRAVPFAGTRVTSAGEGAGELPGDERNLIWRALEAFCRWAGTDVPAVALAADNAIPLERGLGSSAAAAVAGLALGRALTGAPAASRDLIRLAAELEGHPDNAAAALLGGVVLCEGERVTRFEPSAALVPVLCVAEERQATEAARGLLPATVPLADAAANGARAAAVLAGLVGLAPLPAATMVDALHEPARLGAMAGSGRLVAALRGAGVPACLSGAGPSVLALVTAAGPPVGQLAAVAGDGWTVRRAAWQRAGAVTWTAAAARLP